MAERRSMPHAPEAEVSVLGAMLMSEEATAHAAAECRPEMFYRVPHQHAFHAAVRLYERGIKVDPVSMLEELQRAGRLEQAGGHAFVAELMDAVPTAANIGYHIGILRDAATRRAMVKAGGDIAEAAMAPGERTTAELVDLAQQATFGLAAGHSMDRQQHIRAGMLPLMELIEERMHAGGALPGIPTGLRALDDMTGGWQKGDLVIVAARPSMGKTALVTGAALECAMPRNGTAKPVAVYSLEMSREQLVARMVSYESLVNLSNMLKGRLSDDDLVRIGTAAGLLHTAPIWIDDTPAMTALEIRAKARKLKAERPDLGLIIVDYLQLMSGPGENRNQEVSAISRGLKALAKELDVPVLALSQLSRAPESRSDHRPQLSDLRESGSLEQDADLVLFLYRPEYYMTDADAEEKGMVGRAEIIVGKQRNGPTGGIDAYFRRESARFEDFTYEHRQDAA